MRDDEGWSEFYDALDKAACESTAAADKASFGELIYNLVLATTMIVTGLLAWYTPIFDGMM